jgi:hypothetical protein
MHRSLTLCVRFFPLLATKNRRQEERWIRTAEQRIRRGPELQQQQQYHDGASCWFVWFDDVMLFVIADGRVILVWHSRQWALAAR